MGAEILVGVARDTLFRRLVLSKDLKEIREPALFIWVEPCRQRESRHKSSEMRESLAGSSVWKNEGF